MSRTEAITTILSALIAAGLLNFVRDYFKSRTKARQDGSPAAQDRLHLTAADESLVIVAKARDELVEDNKRLREALADERTGREDDRRRWEAREQSYRAEIEALEQKVRAILEELANLKTRHTEA